MSNKKRSARPASNATAANEPASNPTATATDAARLDAAHAMETRQPAGLTSTEQTKYDRAAVVRAEFMASEEGQALMAIVRQARDLSERIDLANDVFDMKSEVVRDGFGHLRDMNLSMLGAVEEIEALLSVSSLASYE